MNEKTKALKTAFPYTIPVLTGFLFLGIAYGVLMSTKGYGAIWSFLMSLIAFCGSMQFVAITLLTTVINQWNSAKNHFPAIIGIISSIICLLIFGQSDFIIPSMISIITVLTVFRKKLEVEVV